MTQANPDNQPDIKQGLFFGFLTALIWGSWPVVSAFGIHQSLNAWDITFLRFAIAGVLLLPIVIKKGLFPKGIFPSCLIAFGAGIPYVAITVQGFQYAPAAHSGVFGPGTLLILTLLGGWKLFGDKPDQKRLVGAAMILSGIVVLAWANLAASTSQQQSDMVSYGQFLFVCGGTCWSIFTLSSRYWGFDSLHATAIVSVISALLYSPVYLWFGSEQLLAAPTEELLLQGFFQGVMAAVLALFFYSRTLVALGAARGAIFASLVPVVALILAVPVLDQIPSWAGMFGAASVTIGMLISLGLLKIRREKRSRAG
ncbi:DMT family transporter [Kiloniella sp. b19]|uniref:DMT family transporter n=1 Tax=Kiloniella sp. GXU_MW_B19 TaxID=3141326 RepID=UPI0031D90593